MTPEAADWDLVARVKAGDDAAFDGLMERYKRPVLSFVYRMIGDADEAQDVAQDVFVRVYQALHKPRFRQRDARFSSWLFQVARHAAIDVLRKRRRRPLEWLSPRHEQGATLSDPEPDAAGRLAATELGRQIAAAAAELPEKQRAIFILADYEGLSYAEIAAVMRCSVKSVETRLYRARQSLRLRLGALREK